jgi:hypothetical protein
MSSLTFEKDEIYNLEKMSIRGGSKTVLSFEFYDEDDLPLDITTSTVIWTLSRFGEPNHTVLSHNGTLSSNNSCIVTLASEDTRDLEGKFVQQITIIDYLGQEYVPSQGIIKINKNNRNI